MITQVVKTFDTKYQRKVKEKKFTYLLIKLGPFLLCKAARSDLGSL